MTKIIGLTGGIGSGKSTIARHFASLGIPVYMADDAGREVMEWPEVVAGLKNTFGETIFENGKLKREVLSKIVFSDPEKLQSLNAIVHPAVKVHFDRWLELHRKDSLIIKEAAILFESGSYKYCDQIITVTAPLETRIERVVQRDRTSRQSVLDRVGNQWTDAMRAAKSDYIIENTDLENAKLQAEQILKKLINQ